MDGYIRVSNVGGRGGERFLSPDLQRESIAGWARAQGVTIGAWHEDLDRSGGTMDRPGMNAALARVASGQTGGVVVARLDRFARTVIGGLTTIERLHEQGARVVSVAESLDPATPMGRAMLGLLLIMAEWQRDQADEHLAASLHRAVGAGRFPGRRPYGLQIADDGSTVVDERAAAVVQRIFAERAGGAGWRKIADGLTRDGIPTPRGRQRWAMTTVQGIVRSEGYLGTFIGPRGFRVEHAWPAIVEHDVWERANGVRGRRDDGRQYRDRLLAGVARCANCRSVLTRTVNPEGYVSYACRGIGCRVRGSVGADILDSHVADLIDGRLSRMRLEARPADDGEARRLHAAREAAQRELEAWRDDVEMRAALGDHDWREGMLARARARDGAETALAELRARGGLLSMEDLPGDVSPSLALLPWEVRRQVVEALLHSVWLRPSGVRGPGARRHVAERVRVVWRDDADRPVLPERLAAVTPGPVSW